MSHRSRHDAGLVVTAVPRVCVLGPESTGKSTLARELAEHFNTVCVPEYARIYSSDKVAVRASSWWPEEFVHIARTQARFEREAARGARDVLICDTDPFSVWVWHRKYSDRVVRELHGICDAEPADLYLLTSPDMPFVDDGVRDSRIERGTMYRVYRGELESSGRRYVEISGDHDERLAQAIEAVDELIHR